MKKALKIPGRLPCWDLCPSRENHPLDSPAARVPVLPVPGHGAQSLCALQHLRDLQGALWGLLQAHQEFSACPELCSTRWGHHNLSVCKLPLPSAWSPPTQPGDEKDSHVLTLLLIALKVKVSWWRYWSVAKIQQVNTIQGNKPRMWGKKDWKIWAFSSCRWQTSFSPHTTSAQGYLGKSTSLYVFSHY